MLLTRGKTNVYRLSNISISFYLSVTTVEQLPLNERMEADQIEQDLFLERACSWGNIYIHSQSFSMDQGWSCGTMFFTVDTLIVGKLVKTGMR